ncbi:MAG: hypothetical protein ACJ8DZ_07065 [Allosphingosinicella sp.]
MGTLSLLLAAFLSGGHSAAPADAAGLGRTAWVLATVEHSEWCPAGNVRLDLRTGRYALTHRAARLACNKAGLERPVITGRLAGSSLAAARAAYRAAVESGLTSPECRNGGRPKMIVITNAGPQILVVATGRFTATPPKDLSCWSDAAYALQRTLEEAFRPPAKAGSGD